MRPSPCTFDDEVAYIHRAIFGTPPPEDVASAYTNAMGVVGSEPGPALQIAVATIVSRRLNVEAIEFYLRVAKGRNTLTQRFQALLYIAEVRPSYLERFRRPGEASRWWIAALRLGIGVSRSVWLFLRGRRLVHRHELVVRHV